MNEPETTFIRPKAIFEWLGITRDDLNKVVSAGLIHPVILPRGTYKKYLTKEIKRVFTPSVAPTVAQRVMVGRQGTMEGKKGVKYETVSKSRKNN